jgi:uncharacterized protein YwgA
MKRRDSDMAVETKEILYMLVDKFDLKWETLGERVRLQKVLYLLQSFGLVKLGYGFSWYKYGPYSQGLVYDAHEVLKNRAEYSTKTKNYRFNDETNGKIEQFKETFSSVLQNPQKLELVASIRFIKNTWYPDLNSDNVFQYLKTHKEKFFDKTVINEEQVKEAFNICQSFSSN